MIRENFPDRNNLTIVVIGKAAAIRAGLSKYGPLTEMKLSDPTFDPTSDSTSNPTRNADRGQPGR